MEMNTAECYQEVLVCIHELITCSYNTLDSSSLSIISMTVAQANVCRTVSV